jgi:Protein of unknown function (DUF2281)
MSIEQAVVEKLRALPTDKQQEVLDFTEFLGLKASKNLQGDSVSVLEAAGDLVGCLKGGAPDLSTNNKYMDGFGEE